jgi:two-component system sensor histidine kinase AlgZ
VARKPLGRPAPVLVYDACQLGATLLTVLFVELVVGVGAMFGASGPLDWLGRMALLTGGALPATLAWLIVGCSLKFVLARLPAKAQYAMGVALGALAGLAGSGIMVLIGVLAPGPWLASACTGALMAGILVAAFALRARGRTPAATAARLLELQARIRPHFLFNTLNSAIALVRAEPRKAEALLEDLSELFRSALVDQGESVTLAQEITLAQRYLEIEQVRFGDRLRVEWSIDPNAGNAKLPPLLLQPLVENAVKHGVEPSAEGAEVKVSTQRRGSVVVIKVTNTVPAGAGRPGNGVAMANVRDRLSLLHDVQAQFQTVLKDGVFQVRMEVPA